jgi:hypothetical protein
VLVNFLDFGITPRRKTIRKNKGARAARSLLESERNEFRKKVGMSKFELSFGPLIFYADNRFAFLNGPLAVI